MAVIKLPPCTSSHQEEELKGNTHHGTERYKITKKKKKTQRLVQPQHWLSIGCDWHKTLVLYRKISPTPEPDLPKYRTQQCLRQWLIPGCLLPLQSTTPPLQFLLKIPNCIFLCHGFRVRFIQRFASAFRLRLAVLETTRHVSAEGDKYGEAGENQPR